MAKSASEKLGIQGLGWIVRRSLQTPASLTPFYQAAFGLRQLRPAAATGSVMLWSGDIVMFEANTLVLGSDTLARKGDFDFVFRARNFDAAKAAILKAGAVVADENHGNGRRLFTRDPDGMSVGLWEAHRDSIFPADAFADKLWQSGGVTLPDTPALPSALQDIASINLKVADPVAMAVFYHEALGLEILGAPKSTGAVLALGRTTVLELHPGGVKRDVLKDRNESPDVWILRVYDHDGLVDRFRSKNVTIVNQVSITGGKITYASDPEGHMFGIQQRTRDLLPDGAKDRIEDIVARKLWAERTNE